MQRNTYLFFFIMLFATSTVFAEEWHPVSDQKSQGISGIAVIDNDHFLVVHDNKKPEQPRLNILNWQKNQKPTPLTPLNWCDQNLPIDLEAITAIPGHKNNYLVLESKGKVTRIQLEADNAACKTIKQFDLPSATKSNMESLALHCFGKRCLLAWAERGDDKTPAKFSWAGFNIETNSIEKSQSGSFDFKAPYPETDLRSISDIAIDSKGAVWVSSTSDPGDDGFFKTALYKIGSFSKEINWTPSKKIAPDTKYENENIKIEALVFTASDLVMATDDENNGAKVARKSLK